jgi:hypothetical protein
MTKSDRMLLQSASTPESRSHAIDELSLSRGFSGWTAALMLVMGGVDLVVMRHFRPIDPPLLFGIELTFLGLMFTIQYMAFDAKVKMLLILNQPIPASQATTPSVTPPPGMEARQP